MAPGRSSSGAASSRDSANGGERNSISDAITGSDSAGAGPIAPSVSRHHPSALSSLGEASGVAILLGNHAKFGLAERCCYHFDLIETLTSLPLGRFQQARSRRRGQSISSQEGGTLSNTENNANSDGAPVQRNVEGMAAVKSSKANKKTPSSNDNANNRCICGVVSLLECVAWGGGVQPDRTIKRAMRSKHREFNTRAQFVWGRSTRSGALKRRDKLGSVGTPRRCHQPRHLPLPLNPNTRVSFAYELTSIAVVVDASPSLTSTFGMRSMAFDLGSFGEEKSEKLQIEDECCVPLDRLGTLIKTYLKGLVQPIDVPPVAVSGLGVAFGRWTPNLAVTVVAAYPPTSKGDHASAGLLVRDFHVTDESSALELASQVEKWAMTEMEDVIAERLCGEREFLGDGVAGRDCRGNQSFPAMSSLGPFSLPTSQRMGSMTCVTTSLKDLLAVGDAALLTLPPEGRPVMLVATDCRNVQCGGVFESLSETARTDVPLSVLDLSSSAVERGTSHSSSAEKDYADMEFSPFLPLSISDDSQSLRDTCHLSGGVFLHSKLLDSYVETTVGSTTTPSSSPLQGDYHFSFKKRSIKPNALQWYTLFSLSPFTPGGSSSPLRSISAAGQSAFYHSSSALSYAGSSFSSTKQFFGKPAELKTHNASADVPIPQDRIVFAKYNIQPVRVKSLLMTRVLEGYHARRYGHNTQDNDKVSVHLVLRLADCGVVLHYEASFVSSPYHVATVGQAHIKLELSGDDMDFIQTVKKMYVLNHVADSMMLQGRRVSVSSRAAAEKICRLLRWIRKEDYLESYLCTPGWGDINHFATGSSFLGRLQSLSKLQRYRHFRSERFDIVTIGQNFYERSDSLFSDVMEQNQGEDEMYSILTSWSTGVISDREMYFKVIVPAKHTDEDLAYYCTIRLFPLPATSRLFTIICDFHGDPSAEQRLAVLFSLKENLKASKNILVLEKCISDMVAIRPASPSQVWLPCWNEYFLHHKNWDLLQEDEVLPLITKRRNELGGFFVLHSNHDRAVFAKFVKSEDEKLDAVIYQALARDDGIFVDIHMEACRNKFYPFHIKDSSFSSIYKKVKERDKDCAKNLRSRSNLLHLFTLNAKFANNGVKQAEDVLRLIKVSICTKKKLQFFNSEGSGLANDLLCRLTTEYITSDSFQTQATRLSIDKSHDILGHTGSWFIMRVDWYVLSLVCFESKDQIQCEEEGVQSYRHLLFFTAGILDLYQSDDDVIGGKNDDDVGNEFGVDEIAGDIECAHAKNFARACYATLRESPVVELRNAEVAYALSPCSFLESLQIFVSVDDLSAHLGSGTQTMTGTKLGAVIGTLLRVVPGSNDEIFFYHGADLPITAEPYINPSNDDIMETDILTVSDGMQPLEEEETNIHHLHPEYSNPPLFFRFLLDHVLVSLNDILALKKSSTLEAQVSIFCMLGEKLPPSHAVVVAKLQSALNSFVSEQTLEKYRYIGSALTEDDFKVVMQNLPNTKHRSSEVMLEFYISKSKSLVAANNPTGNEGDLDHVFSVLVNELDRSTLTIRAGHESFLLLDDSASGSAVLPYFCLITVQKPSGSIVLRVHHPLGKDAAEKQLKVAQSLVKGICDRTNRLLLLDSLCKTKHASNLLIEEELKEDHGEATYSCPVQHKTAIPLHRRCAPQKAILALETTILQNFVIGNRRGIFVYKDEAENVFYLMLGWYKVPDLGETEQNPHMIELLVYGCDKPGPSITDQLVCLLRRKLLTLTLDALSSVLKKNPFFNLLESDLAFIKNFSIALRELDHDTSRSAPCSCIRTYWLPTHVQDPLILLLMFRQNICGSTFIQLLHHEFSSDHDSIEVEEDHGNVERIRFQKLPEFQFYFNSSPSQLDPNYHPLATLTEKGRQYSRQAGSGIAIIEVNLQQGNNSECQIQIGRRGNTIDKKLSVSKSDISLQTQWDPINHNDQFNIRIEITNTTVDIDVVHKWVELSLSQCLAAWNIERHLESSRLGLLHTEPGERVQNDRYKISELLPGLTALEDMVSIASDLPHPAVSRVQMKSNLRATVLADLTLELLEAMLSECNNSNKNKGISSIRYTSTDTSLVDISRDNAGKNCIRVEQLGKAGKILKDRPTDSPEYIAVFGLNGRDQKSFVDTTQNQFFEQVFVQTSTQQETTASSFFQVLSRIKKAKPTLFHRHLAFILKVSRSTRTLLIYNANPQVRLKMELSFKEINDEATKANKRCTAHLQRRCLRHISFVSNEPLKQPTAANQTSPDPAKKKTQEMKPAKEEAIVKRGPARRIPRPTSMLRPKLIGRSVDGAAMQAVTASRLRASSRPSLPQRSASGTGKKKTVTAPLREKPMPKVRRAPESQKTNTESNIKESVSITRSSATQASMLKTYKAFMSLLKEESSLLTLSPRLGHYALQHLAHTFLTSSEEKGLTFASARIFCTCYGNFLGAGSVQQLNCDREIASAKKFIDYLTKRWSSKTIVPVTGDYSSNNHLPPCFFMRKDLLANSSRRAVILMEVSIPWDSVQDCFVFYYKAWLVNTTSKAKADNVPGSPCASLHSIEKEVAFIEVVAQGFLAELNLERELFHFACHRAMRMAQGTGPIHDLATLTVLKSTVARYCVDCQARLPSPGFTIQRRFLSLSSFLEGPVLESCERATLFAHLLSNCQRYSLKCNGLGMDSCFAGKLEVVGFSVYYFIGQHESVELALDVFILCVTKGQCTQTYITKRGLPFAEKISDVVLYSAMTTVQDLVEAAAKRIRKMFLWESFGRNYTPPSEPGGTLMDNIAELRTFSYGLDLISIDNRLTTLLYDKSNELQLSWHDALNTITRSPSFSHSVTCEGKETSNYVIYYEGDIFLDFVLDKHGKMCKARILAREEFVYDESSNAHESIKAKFAVKEFTLFLMQWMWIDCELGF